MLKRVTLVAIGPAVALAIIVGAVVAHADALPDPLATHWGTSGRPDGSTPLGLFVGGVVAIVLAAWASLLVHARRRAAGLRLTAAPFVWGTLALMAGVVVTTVAANDGVADWRAADPLTLGHALAVSAVAVLAAVAAWALERGRPVARVDRATPAATLELADGEQVAWARSVASRPLTIVVVAIGVAPIVVALVAGGVPDWWLVGGCLIAATVGLAVGEIVVTVDARGLTIAYGPWSWPRQTVPVGQVAAAETTDLDPWSVGGWGYRKVPGRPGVTAVVIRGGSALRVVRDDGRELLVTVPDADTAAALLQTLAARNGGSGS